MLEYIQLMQTTPVDEPCAQVGSENYLKQARIEAWTYVNQLTRILGTLPPGSFFRVVKCPHDFGTYIDLRFYYDDEDQQHVQYMMAVERGCGKWDDGARKELEEKDYEFDRKKM